MYNYPSFSTGKGEMLSGISPPSDEEGDMFPSAIRFSPFHVNWAKLDELE